MLSLLAGLALAQGPEPETGGEVTWLILDPVRPVDEVVASLLPALAALEGTGLIIDFDPVPQASAPVAGTALILTLSTSRTKTAALLPVAWPQATIPSSALVLIESTGRLRPTASLPGKRNPA
jgi:hypothetical protein